jgi:hypothetical protein
MRKRNLEGLSSDEPTEGLLMKKTTAISCVFLDIGGVLLTDGWDLGHAYQFA